MLDPLKEVFEEGLLEGGEEEEIEEVEEKIPTKRFGYSKALPIYQDEFDVLNLYSSKEPIKKYKFSNKSGLLIEVMNFGATILTVRMPDKFGNTGDVLLGFATVQEYYEQNCKFGAMIGRTSNIIEDANFQHGNELHFLRKNSDAHHRDGGVMSFDKVIWKSYVEKATNTLIMTYLSENQEEGYPGNLLTRISMKLSDENEFIITINAVCDESTPVDIAPRLFFNLAGHGAGEEKIKDHKMQINADMYIMQDSRGIPTGRLKHVNQTYFDLRTPRPFHFALDRIRGGGYKHTFCLNKSHRYDAQGVVFAGRLEEPESGRYVEIWTDAPGLYFYTANNFPKPECPEEEVQAEEPIMSTISQPKPMSKSESRIGGLFGKHDKQYFRHGAVALSPQGYPNSVNMPTFPSSIIQPHKAFQRKIIYQFGVSSKIMAHPKAIKSKENVERSRKSLDHSQIVEEEKE
ncbi:hypothetical protein M8J76_000532 [Diaphorina citri]|nr:hypothetical protein M8J75_002362 [Diaphorina citri]KAI5744251.1 hypothetical protein M8J76_000532 [Diaphorina citri]